MTRAVWKRLEEMTWTELDSLDKDRTVIFMPAGPLEQHGPHLALGTDIFAAEEITRRVMARIAPQLDWTLLLAPTLVHGAAILSRPYPGTVSVRRTVQAEFCSDVLTSFVNNGFRWLVVTSQHLDPPYIFAWEEACLRANAAGGRVIHGYERLLFDDLFRDGTFTRVNGCDSDGESHAGVFETSQMLCSHKGAVRTEMLPRLERVRLDFNRDLRTARSWRELGNGLGYTGNPVDATAERGERIYEYYVARYAELVLRHLGGEDVWDRLSIAAYFESKR